jgi:hypothetical protein
VNKPRDQVPRPPLHVDEDAFGEPEIILHPTVAELLEQRRRKGKVKLGDLARLLAAIKAAHEILGQTRPEHRSATNAPVPVEILQVIGEILAGPEGWAEKENAARAAEAGAKREPLQKRAEKIRRDKPGLSTRAIAKILDPVNFDKLRRKIFKPKK